MYTGGSESGVDDEVMTCGGPKMLVCPDARHPYPTSPSTGLAVYAGGGSIAAAAVIEGWLLELAIEALSSVGLSACRCCCCRWRRSWLYASTPWASTNASSWCSSSPGGMAFGGGLACRI